MRASTVEYQGVVERGTEREEEIPRSTRDRVRYFNKICSKVTEDVSGDVGMERERERE